MSGEHEIGDYRFAGYSNEELATMVDQVRQGPGSESMRRAVDALTAIANSLKETDSVLHTELAKIGVEWQSAASDDAQVVMTDSAQYGGSATGSITGSADAVNNQGHDFSRTRHSAPEASSLRGAKDYSIVDTLLFHTTDHSKEVQKTQAARQQAIDSMNGYTDASRQNLASYQCLPVPPALSLETQPIGHASTGTGVQSFGSGTPGPFGSCADAPRVPGGGASPGTLGFEDVARQGPIGGAPGVPGGPPGSNPPGLPGRMVGTGPMPGPGATPPVPAPPAFRPTFAGLDAAVAGMAGGAGGGAAVGAFADKERLVRGGRTGGGVVGEGPGRAGGSRGAAAVGGPPHEDATARAAERVGSRSRPGSSIMQPVAGTAQGEEDDEHVRKYGVEAEDVFADDRMVIPSVLGEDDDE
jgi:hypothetical protein